MEDEKNDKNCKVLPFIRPEVANPIIAINNLILGIQQSGKGIVAVVAGVIMEDGSSLAVSTWDSSKLKDEVGTVALLGLAELLKQNILDSK